MATINPLSGRWRDWGWFLVLSYRSHDTLEPVLFDNSPVIARRAESRGAIGNVGGRGHEAPPSSKVVEVVYYIGTTAPCPYEDRQSQHVSV